MKTVTVRIPATSANCGPAFDCMGVACSLYDDFTYAIETDHLGLRLRTTGEGAGQLHPSSHNLAFASFLKIWNRYTNHQKIGITLTMHNDIPLSRGLGSSSAAIVGGIVAASELSGAQLSQEELLNYANMIEGHPDNVAPALYGGFTISCLENGRPHCLRFLPAQPLQFIAVVPDNPLSTALARQALPAKVPFTDAVFNESRSALLTGALLTGRWDLLQIALEDRLHQPYRAHLIPGMGTVFQAGRQAGALNCIISGAGSTLMAYADPETNGEAVGRAMVQAFRSLGQKAVYHILQLDQQGARVVDVP